MWALACRSSFSRSSTATVRDVSSRRIIASTDIETIRFRACSTRPWYETPSGSSSDSIWAASPVSSSIEASSDSTASCFSPKRESASLMKRTSAAPWSSSNMTAVPELRKAHDAREAARLVGRVGGDLLGAAAVRGAEDEHLGDAPAAQEPLGGLAGDEAEALALQLVGRPAARFGDDRRRTRSGAACVSASLPMSAEQPAEEGLLGDRLVDLRARASARSRRSRRCGASRR